MKKPAFLLLLTALPLGLSACAPVTITKTYTETYVDPHTGKTITYTESITQIPEQRLPMHLQHPELYQ